MSQAATTGHKRSRNDTGNKATVVLGAQWGDEGKGKVVDLLATEADLVCRCQVNASLIRDFVISLSRGVSMYYHCKTFFI